MHIFDEFANCFIWRMNVETILLFCCIVVAAVAIVHFGLWCLVVYKAFGAVMEVLLRNGMEMQ